ncbi:MAG: DUF434 domain-containing protein [Nitrospiraceae bacterium]|nr:DUF434 domain-containing protein [Nitrospiraceae bacterium]
MGQRQRHRGQHPEDARLFAPRWIPALREAVADLSFLLSRRYAPKSALKLVGDKFQLDARQRRAVGRAACSDESLAHRQAHDVPVDQLAGRDLLIDGYNLLILIESALSGGILLRGRDGCIRDMASIHGSYRTVEETLPAVHRIGEAFDALGIATAKWYFDAPVSNSGKLKVFLLEEAARAGWPWQIDIEHNPDKILAVAQDPVVTSDSWILDRADAWTPLVSHVIGGVPLENPVIDLSDQAV